MDVSLSEIRELVMDREAWRAAIHGVAKNPTRLSDWTELNWGGIKHSTDLCLHKTKFIKYKVQTKLYEPMYILLTLHHLKSMPFFRPCPLFLFTVFYFVIKLFYIKDWVHLPASLEEEGNLYKHIRSDHNALDSPR